MLDRLEQPEVAACLKRTGVAVFNGECSWNPGQLESELERGMWLIVRSPAVLEAITAPQSPPAAIEDVWSRCLRALGGEYAALVSIPPHVVMDDLHNIDY